MQIRYPAIVYITAKASDNGLDSAYTIEAFFSPTKSDNPITEGGKTSDNTEIITNQVKETITIESDNEETSNVALVLLIILIILAIFAVVVVCIYNRRKPGGLCLKKVPIDAKKNAGPRINPDM